MASLHAGIGRDRTAKTGSNATGQYQPPVAAVFEDVNTCPENLLLWFHHVSWDHRLRSTNTTVWEALLAKYDAGVARTGEFVQIWKALQPYIDRERYEHVAARLELQHAHAKKFREVWVRHFQTVRGRLP